MSIQPNDEDPRTRGARYRTGIGTSSPSALEGSQGSAGSRIPVVHQSQSCGIRLQPVGRCVISGRPTFVFTPILLNWHKRSPLPRRRRSPASRETQQP